MFNRDKAIYKTYVQKQPSRGVLKKRCSENTQQTYRILFSKFALQLY